MERKPGCTYEGDENCDLLCDECEFFDPEYEDDEDMDDEDMDDEDMDDEDYEEEAEIDLDM